MHHVQAAGSGVPALILSRRLKIEAVLDDIAATVGKEGAAPLLPVLPMALAAGAPPQRI